MEFTVNNTPFSDALALRATASVFDAQRGKLPGPRNLHHSPDGVAVAVAKQISELGQLITDLGDEILFRTVAQDREAHTARVITSFAAAVRPAGEAASALGTVAHQLAFLHQTEHLRNQPDARDAREAAARVIDDALGLADTALGEAADSFTPHRRRFRLRPCGSRPPATGPRPQLPLHLPLMPRP